MIKKYFKYWPVVLFFAEIIFSLFNGEFIYFCLGGFFIGIIAGPLGVVLGGLIGILIKFLWF